MAQINFTSDRSAMRYWSRILRCLRDEYYTLPQPARSVQGFDLWLKETWGTELYYGHDLSYHYGIAGINVDDKYMTMLMLKVPA